MIKDLKELERLLKLCRKQGVTEISFGEVSFKLGELPRSDDKASQVVEAEDKFANFPEGELTPEQLLFYSSGGSPEDDPFREAQQ